MGDSTQVLRAHILLLHPYSGTGKAELHNSTACRTPVTTCRHPAFWLPLTETFLAPLTQPFRDHVRGNDRRGCRPALRQRTDLLPHLTHIYDNIFTLFGQRVTKGCHPIPKCSSFIAVNTRPSRGKPSR